MAIIATDSITLAVMVDVQKVDIWYCQTLATAPQPTIDTSSATPTGWSSTEPEYDSSKQLWTCVKTTLTNGLWYWGAVSKSSSYSGANSAWNKAAAAQGSANAAVKSSATVYYRSTAGAPTISASDPIGTDGDASDSWQYVMPSPRRGCAFYCCERFVYVDDSLGFGPVRSLDNATYTSMWCSEADETLLDGGRLYTGSVTADKIAAGSITVGALGEDVAKAIGDSAGLTYDFDVSLENGVYTFTAHAWRGSEEITGQLPDEFFSWELKKGDGETSLGTGKTKAVQASSAGYRAIVVGRLAEVLEVAVTDGSGRSVVDGSGRELLAAVKA